MADPITVYKIVRPEDGGVLRSCVLRGTSAHYYRDKKGRLRTVKRSLAFDSQEHARAFRGSGIMGPLGGQVWSASADSVTPRELVGTMYGGDRQPRCRRTAEASCLIGHWSTFRAPSGSLDCTNLRLVERVA